IPADARSGQVSFGTFHSFFYQILRSSERYPHYHIIGEPDKQKLLYPLLKEIKGRRDGEESKYFDPVSQDEVSRILSVISYGKNTGGGAEARERLPEHWRECYEEILQGYERQKEQRRQLDLDDLLALTARELKRDKGLLQYWQCRYPYVLVDEFQDCNPVQYEIVKMLYPPGQPGANIFVVGDDDQAIYGFRGADPGIMQRFLEEYVEPQKAVVGSGAGAGPDREFHVVLGRNYRCAPEIVDASARVIACNRQRVSKQLTSGREPGGSVQMISFAGGREERRYVLSQCQGRTPQELDRFAVLFRTNGLMGIFAAELMQAGIPFVTREKIGSIYEHFVVRDVTDYFRAAHGCRERQLFLRIWNRPRLRVGREALDSPEVDFGRIKRFYSERPYENPAAVRHVEQFERKLEQLRRFSLELGITFIRRGFGYEDYLRQRSGSNI
ncbi:MAG: ATP-dependent helicase, partial [Acetatifactor sp.]|nr:ATP-dependent helicase [Acetatifactor sp.]